MGRLNDSSADCPELGYTVEWTRQWDDFEREVEQMSDIRKFETGATRDSETGKYDYEGFLSPLAIERFGQYMNKHRVMSNGGLRDSDNWQHGIPIPVYMKSLFRHMIDLWFIIRGHERKDTKTGEAVTVEEACCAILFNTQGILHETLKVKNNRV